MRIFNLIEVFSVRKIINHSQDMSSITTKLPLSPPALSLLPLFYVGWSDSVLSPSEMKMIHAQIMAMPFLTAADKKYLLRWTDPLSPPDEEVFRSWLEAIKYYGGRVPDASGLVELGLAVAAAGGAENTAMDRSTKEHLDKLARTLGVEGRLSGVMLLDTGLNKSDASRYSTIDVPAMITHLDGDHHQLSDRIRQLLKDPLFKQKFNPSKEAFRQLTLDRIKALAQQGLSAYSFPQEFGGGGRRREHITVFEMLGYSDLSMTIKFGVQFGLFGGALYLLGTHEHHRKYLEPMLKGQLLGCFAMTETGHGSNVKGLETTATYDAQTDEIIINSPSFESGKEYIGNALHASMAVVFAQLIVEGVGHGVHAILVPIRSAQKHPLVGVRIEDCGYKMGLNGVDNGRIWFDQVRVPRENLLNKYADITEEGKYVSPIASDAKRFFTMLGALVVGRICVGLAGVSASKKALTIAIKYALKRRQFNHKDSDPETLIMDYPTHQHRLLPLLATTYAYHFALRSLADEYAESDGEDMRRIETLAAGLKSKATWHATQTIQECREACGGKGYLMENQLATLKADTDIFTTFEGDNTVLMQLVAKGILTEFKQSFHDDSTGAVIRVILKRINYSIQELNPFQKGNTDSEHILSDEFIREALEYRYQKHLMSLSERMQKYLKRKLDPYQAFLKVQLHMVEMAHAYIDKLCYESLSEQAYTHATANQQSFIQLSQLYGLTILEQNKGWFLENDYCYGSKTKAIRRVRAKLIADLRPDAEALVDAFGIPTELLAAQIVD